MSSPPQQMCTEGPETAWVRGGHEAERNTVSELVGSRQPWPSPVEGDGTPRRVAAGTLWPGPHSSMATPALLQAMASRGNLERAQPTMGDEACPGPRLGTCPAGPAPRASSPHHPPAGGAPGPGCLLLHWVCWGLPPTSAPPWGPRHWARCRLTVGRGACAPRKASRAFPLQSHEVSWQLASCLSFPALYVGT